MKLNRLFTTLLLILCTTATVLAQKEAHAVYQPMEDGTVKISWTVNFAAETGFFQGRTQKEGLGMIPIEVPQEQIKPEYDKPLNPTKTTFTVFIAYGPDRPLGLNTVFADITVGAFSGPKETPTSTASTLISINSAALRDYYSKLSKIKELEDKIGTLVPKPDPARLLPGSGAIKISDRSVTLRLLSSQTIKVNVFAYETNDPSKATGDTIFNKKDVLLFENKPEDVKVPEMRGNKGYILVVEEIPSAMNPATRKTLREVISRDINGAQIKTLPEVSKPSIRFAGTPQPKRNDAVYVEISATEATDVFAYVEASYDNGDYTKVSDEVRISRKSGPAPVDPTMFAKEIPVALIAGRMYRVQARAVTDKSDDVEPATTKSLEFKGLPMKLFDLVTFDIGGENLKFTPTGVTEPIKTSIVVKVNDKQLLSPCVEGGPAQPSCEVSVTQIFAALIDKSKNPATAATATPQKSTISFEVTVKAADQSERAQSTTFAMSVAQPNLTTSAAKNNWNNVLQFGKDLITGNGNTKLEPNKVKGSGIAGFLGSLLRGFLVL